MFNPADIVTRGVSHHPPPSRSKQPEAIAKPSPEKKERRRKEINLTKPDALVDKPIVKVMMREPKEALALLKEHEAMVQAAKKAVEEPKKEEPKPVEEKPKVKRERKPKVDMAAKLEEMTKMISDLKKDKASQDEKHAMEIKGEEDKIEKEAKVKVPRKGRFPKGSQEAKDYMAAMRAKKTKK
jgi:hypothetical protein